ncbi:MAG: class I adenylate-forming enzyme family protein [Pseudomonadota bacterium]
MILSSSARSAEWAQVGYFGGQTLDGALAAVVARQPRDVLLQFWGAKSEPAMRLTAVEVDAIVSAVADAFLDIGLKQDDALLVQVAPRLHTVLLLLGASRANLVTVPVPGISSRNSLRRLMERTRAKAAIIDLSVPNANTPKAMVEATTDVFDMRFLLSVGGTAPDGILPLDTVLTGETWAGQMAQPVPRPERPADHVAMVWPQTDDLNAPLLARSHNELLAAGLNTVLSLGLSSEDALFSPLMPQRLSGLSTTMMAWLLTGATLNISAPQDWAALQNAIVRNEDRRRVVCLPGKLAGIVAPALPAPADVLRVWNDPMAPSVQGSTIEPSAAGHGRIVADAINIAECGLLVRGPSTTPSALSFAGKRNAEQDLPKFVEAKLAGGVEKAGDLPDREGLIRGEILLSGPGTPSAPFPEPTSANTEDTNSRAPLFDGGFLKTGLRGHLTDGPKGPEIHVIGSVDAVRRIGSRTYNLGELDTALRALPGVRDAAAFEIPGGLAGSRIGAAIVPDAEPPSLDMLRRNLIDRGHSPHTLPVKLSILTGIPRSPEGVVNRDALVVDRLAV